jgi:EAL domain-containing protein (putative c-di-GMP-specific phosphodiesterase class I)
MAEQTGLVIPIDRWMLREACRHLHLWKTRFPWCSPLVMSVNLSGRQLTQPDLVERVGAIRAETGVDGRDLWIEITESALIENPDLAIDLLTRLKALGPQVLIDDFGTGFSSLSYLSRFPVDVLKVSQHFVSAMNGGGAHAEIIRMIVTLAHSLRMTVIAEGIETAEQAAQIKALPCEYGQGYFFSYPVDAEGAAALIASAKRW